MPGCKLNRNAVKCLVERGTSCEISMLLYISRICNSFGSLRDLNYHNVCKELGISQQSFYNTLYSLEEKGLILIDKYDSCINCTIINNLYHKENFKQGYINTNHDFLYSKEFINAKVNVKKIVLMFLLGYKNKLNAYVLKIRTLINNLGGLKRKSVVWEYLNVLKQWFIIGEKRKSPMEDSIITLYLIYPGSTKKVMELYWHNIIDNFCRNYDIEATEKNKEDVISLIKIYSHNKNNAREFNLLLDTICKTSLSHNALIPALINKTLKYKLITPTP